MTRHEHDWNSIRWTARGDCVRSQAIENVGLTRLIVGVTFVANGPVDGSLWVETTTSGNTSRLEGTEHAFDASGQRSFQFDLGHETPVHVVVRRREGADLSVVGKFALRPES